MRRYDHALAKVAAITEKLPVGTTEPKVVRLDLADLASVAEVVRAWDGTATYPGQQCCSRTTLGSVVPAGSFQ